MAAEKSASGSLQLQPRDLAFLRGLFESRIMTGQHASILYFEGKHEYAKKRLQKIKAAGYIGARERNANEKSILFLTRKAFTLIKSQGALPEHLAIGKSFFETRANVSELTLKHELEIMDVKAAFHSALTPAQAFSLTEFSTWPLLYQFKTSHSGFGSDLLVQPDGFICIHEKEEGSKGFAHDFFLEVDRSSKTLDALVSQIVRYVEYYRSGGFAVRNGAAPDKFKEYPFRVMVVLVSAVRRNNLAERLFQNNPPILGLAWLTTFAEVTADSLGAIWIQPGEYRNALKGTEFYQEQSNRSFEFRHRPEREAFIEQHVKKRKILEDE